MRSRKDANAVKASIEKFAPGSLIKVESMGGLRGGRLEEALLDTINPFSLILLGRSESEVAEAIEEGLPPFSEVIVTKASKVRNNTIEAIYGYISKGRASIRLHTRWTGSSFRFARGKGIPLRDLPVHPQSDSFIVYNTGARLLSIFLVRSLGGVALLFKRGGGRHLVYSGPEPIGEVVIDKGDRPPRASAYRRSKPFKSTLEEVVAENSDVMKVLEEYSINLLMESEPEPDTVIVPWSGGKDSTAALLLAVEAYGRDRVKAVYVDTGIDFIENLEYVEDVAGKLGVDLIVERADVDQGLLLEEMPMPDPEYRWCTGRKLEALRRGVRSLIKGNTIIVAGDRDAESEKRAKRPLVRVDERLGLRVVSPLKLWSGSHVQTYILWKRYPLNKLYEAGFYRIGCYICFALRGWELAVMRKTGVMRRIIEERPSHKVLIDKFIELKRKGFGGDLGDCLCNA